MLSSSSNTCGACGATNQPQAKFCHICGFAMQPVVAPSMFNSATGQLVSNVLLKQRYRILYPVGQGGMGAVYAAEDTQLGNRKVALKEMRQSGLSPQEVIASFAFLKTRGYYKSRRAIGLAIFISTIGLIVYSLIEATGDNISYHNGWGATFSAYLPLTFANIIVAAVLLPIILRMTNKMRGL